jgi:hypothetical protein
VNPGVVVCITPRDVIDLIEIGAPKGQISVQDVVISISVPAGYTTYYSFRLPDDWVSVARSPYLFTSNYYNEAITMEVTIDVERRPITYGTIPLTVPRTIKLDFITKHNGMDIKFTNGTTTDALITMECSVVWLERSYWEEFYAPLMKKIYDLVFGEGLTT